MRVSPDRADPLLLFDRHANASTGAKGYPFRLAFDLKPVKYLVDSTDETIKLLEGVTRRGSDAEFNSERL